MGYKSIMQMIDYKVGCKKNLIFRQMSLAGGGGYSAWKKTFLLNKFFYIVTPSMSMSSDKIFLFFKGEKSRFFLFFVP